jgi:4-amino-4-deoxy-L-arabinose transferase-like glycosyltransferase
MNLFTHHVDKNRNRGIALHVFILLVVTYFVIFLKLGEFHMRIWDESMFAVNTYEMMHNGHYFANYYDGHPDICNSKPVLTLWTQMFFVKLFGYNELSLRLPSAIAATISILLVFIFLYKNYNALWAWAGALVLLTSTGFIGYHTARTGEADSLLTMFVLIANLSFLKFLLTEKKQQILYFFLFLTLAFATKMVAALLFLPALLIVLLIVRKFKGFVFNWHFVAGALFFILLNMVLMVLRNHENPGYLHDFFSRDAGRLFHVVDGFSGVFTFYIDNLINIRFSTWFILLMIGLLMTFFSKDEKERSLLLAVFVFTLVYLFIISASATKVSWYDMPLYPYISIIAAYPILIFIRWIQGFQHSTSPLKTILIVFLIFSYPYYMMFRQSQANSLNGFEKMNEASERFLFERNNDHVDLSGIKVYSTGFNASLLFYKYKMHEMKQNIELVEDGEFAVYDNVLVSNDSLKKILQKKYSYRTLDHYDNAQLIKIDSLKNQK